MAKGDEALLGVVRSQAQFILTEAAALIAYIQGIEQPPRLVGGKEGEVAKHVGHTEGMAASLAATTKLLKLRQKRAVPDMQLSLPGMAPVANRRMSELVRAMHENAVADGMSVTLSTPDGASAHYGIPEDEAQRAEEAARAARGAANGEGDDR